MKKVHLFLVTSLSLATVVNAAAPVASDVDPAVMATAFPADGALAKVATDARVVQARDLVAKSLGDDARDLVFIPITPCTVWDTRFATDAASSGIIANGVTKKFFSHHAGAGDFTTWGGNPSCPETTLASIGIRPYAVMMTAYVNDATGNGWVTFYREGDTDPSQATISVYYSPGPTRTQTVISKSNRGYGSGSMYDIAVTSRFASAHVSASVVGYFFKPVNITLPNSTATTGNVLKGADRFLHNTGFGSVYLGVRAGNFGAVSGNNVGVGLEALSSNTDGGGGTAVGYRALANNNFSPYNSAFGHRALEAESGDLTKGRNNAFGAFALYQLTTGRHNVGVGADALSNLTTGDFNIALGSGGLSGFATTGSFNIVIGNAGVASESNTIRIGTTANHTRTFLSGVRGVTTGSANGIAVLIDSNGQLGTVSSSREAKDHIADMDRASDALMKLRPVTFHYRAHGEAAPLQYGLVAEEVEQVYPDLVAKANDGKTETVMYQFLPPMLLNEYQKQQKRIEAQDAEIAALKAAVARLERLVK